MLVFLYYLVSPFGPDYTYLLITYYLAPAELHLKNGLNMPLKRLKNSF